MHPRQRLLASYINFLLSAFEGGWNKGKSFGSTQSRSKESHITKKERKGQENEM